MNQGKKRQHPEPEKDDFGLKGFGDLYETGGKEVEKTPVPTTYETKEGKKVKKATLARADTATFFTQAINYNLNIIEKAFNEENETLNTDEFWNRLFINHGNARNYLDSTTISLEETSPDDFGKVLNYYISLKRYEDAIKKLALKKGPERQISAIEYFDRDSSDTSYQLLHDRYIKPTDEQRRTLIQDNNVYKYIREVIEKDPKSLSLSLLEDIAKYTEKPGAQKANELFNDGFDTISTGFLAKRGSFKKISKTDGPNPLIPSEKTFETLANYAKDNPEKEKLLNRDRKKYDDDWNKKVVESQRKGSKIQQSVTQKIHEVIPDVDIPEGDVQKMIEDVQKGLKDIKGEAVMDEDAVQKVIKKKPITSGEQFQEANPSDVESMDTSIPKPQMSKPTNTAKQIAKKAQQKDLGISKLGHRPTSDSSKGEIVKYVPPLNEEVKQLPSSQPMSQLPPSQDRGLIEAPPSTQQLPPPPLTQQLTGPQATPQLPPSSTTPLLPPSPSTQQLTGPPPTPQLPLPPPTQQLTGPQATPQLPPSPSTPLLPPAQVPGRLPPPQALQPNLPLTRSPTIQGITRPQPPQRLPPTQPQKQIAAALPNLQPIQTPSSFVPDATLEQGNLMLKDSPMNLPPPPIEDPRPNMSQPLRPEMSSPLPTMPRPILAPRQKNAFLPPPAPPVNSPQIPEMMDVDPPQGFEQAEPVNINPPNNAPPENMNQIAETSIPSNVPNQTIPGNITDEAIHPYAYTDPNNGAVTAPPAPGTGTSETSPSNNPCQNNLLPESLRKTARDTLLRINNRLASINWNIVTKQELAQVINQINIEKNNLNAEFILLGLPLSESLNFIDFQQIISSLTDIVRATKQ